MKYVEAALEKHKDNKNLDAVRTRLESVDAGVLAKMSKSETLELVESIIVSMQHAEDTIDQHTAFTLNEQPKMALGHVFPAGFADEVSRRLAEIPQYQVEAANDEVVCSLESDRKVRFSPASLVVTPIKINESM